MKSLMINSDEIFLKGRNIGEFKQTLNIHLRELIGRVHPDKFRYEKFNCNYLISSETPFSKELLNRLLRVPGVQSVDIVEQIPGDLEIASEKIQEYFRTRESFPKTFKIEAKRIDKTFSQGSREIILTLGEKALKAFPKLRVDIHNPEVEVFVKVIKGSISLRLERFLGLGGLPVGKSGHILTLLSGGFDSPVASVLMSKRGTRQSFVFFHAYPFVGDEVLEKIKLLARELAQFQKGCDLHIVPIGNLQKEISKKCRESYRTLLFRRLMVELANKLASEIEAEALCTGDALGQVSSQTLGNMAMMDKFSHLPILRPLVGQNKKEIISLSQKFGLQALSLIPHDDACSLFAPQLPVVKPSLGYMDNFSFDYADQMDQALKMRKVFHYDFLGKES